MTSYSLLYTELSDLLEAHTKLREKIYTNRVKAIIVLGSGWPVIIGGERPLFKFNMIRTYYRQYKKGSRLKILKTKHVESTSFLSASKANKLDSYLLANLHIATKLVTAY